MSNSSSSSKINRDLAARIEMTDAWRGVNYCQAIQSLFPEVGGQVLEIAGGFALFAGQRFPSNSVAGLGMLEQANEELLQSIETFYFSLGMPARVQYCPFAGESLKQLLEQRNYRLERENDMLVSFLPGRLDEQEPP